MFGAEHQRLTRDEELRLGRLAREGDTEARQRLAMSVAPLVLRLCSKYAGRGVETDDLFGEGMLGALNAVKGYCPEQGRFTTYVVHWVRKYLIRATNEYRGPFRLNRHAGGLALRLRRAKEELRAELGHLPSFSEVRERSGLAGWELDAACAADPDSWCRRTLDNACTLPREQDDDQPETGLRDLADRAGLTAQEYAVIEGLYGGRERPLVDVARSLGISPGAGRRRYASAVAKLRRVGRDALLAG